MKWYLLMWVELLLVDCVVNLVEECVDIVVCILCVIDLVLIVWCLVLCCLVLCVVLLYLVECGVLMIVDVLVLYNCFIYYYVGKSVWYLKCDGCVIVVVVGGNISVNEVLLLLEVVCVGVGIVMLFIY